ncbi:peroxiredoxin Q/BCP [Dokdonella fugitiva]|uniref:thioredoxin-dependent peroxiredoxin n=1 Tax=Dokdonella fugitiva TaxID=328517 RepID=A0A839F0A1_9GAMM|nr:peroxiredoxin [Dokdonella fugitiva]MBA8888036.1 peroxiredoxin Q/BCP [Dokdonella fugitiva]
MPDIGKKVPKLKGVLHDGSTLALADLRGQAVAVYFYPKDNTPGCTNEAHGFRDLYKQFRKAGCEIVGVSRDSTASHAKFRQKHALPFPLVADTDEAWCNAFGVLGEKTLYGRKFVGVIRSTFLVDAEGTLVAEWRNVRVPGHAAAVLERATQL